MAQQNDDDTQVAQPKSVGGILLTGFAVLGAPLTWMLHFNVMYFLVQPICRLGGEAMFHIVSVAALLVIAGAGVAAWRIGQRVDTDFRGKLEGKGGWQGFIGAYGLFSAAMFAYAAIYTWSPVLRVDACTGMT